MTYKGYVFAKEITRLVVWYSMVGMLIAGALLWSMSYKYAFFARMSENYIGLHYGISTFNGKVTLIQSSEAEDEFKVGYYRFHNMISFPENARVLGTVSTLYYAGGFGWASGDYSFGIWEDPRPLAGKRFDYMSVPWYAICFFLVLLILFRSWSRFRLFTRGFEIILAKKSIVNPETDTKK